MNKVGLKRIGIADKISINDVNQSQQGQVVNLRGIQPGVLWFASIDQRDSSLSEELSSDENGLKYDISVNFVVRNTSDIARVKNYMRRPVVMYVETVDGNSITLGTPTYPVFMETEDEWNNLTVRQLSVKVKYESLTSLI